MVQTVSDLIEWLQEYPPEMRVVVCGYEGGFNDINDVEEVNIAENVNCSPYFGEHDYADAKHPVVRALVLGGCNHLTSPG